MSKNSDCAARLPELEVPAAQPFRNDRLRRSELAGPLTEIVNNTNGPFVLSISASWGTGKTTFLKMWERHLQDSGHKTVYLNAWETDFAADPLAPLIGRLSDLATTLGESHRMDKAKKVAARVAKRAVPVGVRILTLGVIDAEEEIEKVLSDALSDAAGDLVANFAKEEQSLESLRAYLRDFAVNATKDSESAKLVVLLDDLDRCRPNYAIEVLERVKHVFNIERVIFVLAIDREQLSSSLGRVYGVKTDAAEYLRRFVDVDFQLPVLTTEEFFESLFYRYGIVDDFRSRGATEKLDPILSTAKVFFRLSQAFDLKLRAQENSFARLVLVTKSTDRSTPLFGVFLAFLVLVREWNASVFSDYVTGRKSPKDLILSVQELTHGRKLLSSPEGELLEAQIILGSPRQDFVRQIVDESTHAVRQHYARARGSFKEAPEEIRRIERVHALMESQLSRALEIRSLFPRIDFVMKFER